MTATELLLKQENEFLQARLRVLEENTPDQRNWYNGSVDLMEMEFPGQDCVLRETIRIAFQQKGFTRCVLAKLPDGTALYMEQDHWKTLTSYEKAKVLDMAVQKFMAQAIEMIRKGDL